MKRILSLAALTLSPFCPGGAGAAELKVLLPLGRVAYQTNERIDVSVLRKSPDGLREGPLVLTLDGPQGSRLQFTFTARAAEGKLAVATEHLHLNGHLLRPGRYTLRAEADGSAAAAEIEVHGHLRKSSFKTIDWASRAAKHEQAVLGEDSLGFNTLLYAYGGLDVDETIRGGLDYMRNCVMGGWHYMDLRRECDWSDPAVLGGGIARATREVFQDRMNPNCVGVHLYDEPFLAEVKDPADPEGKRLVRHGVPAQERSFQAAFGHEPPKFGQMDFTKPSDARRWAEYNRWRLLLLEAAWKIACHGVTTAEPGYLPISQTQWAWQAFDAGYYFNVNRPFPVVSRHALYDYKHGGDFAPSFAFEFGRVRDLNKPNWYLPMWGCGRPDLFRAEQYLSFMNNLQGLAKPPDLLIHRPSRTPAAPGIVASNKTALRLGPVFDTLPVTRPEVAVLYSMSHNLHERTRDSMDSYRGNRHFQNLLFVYMASKLLHTPVFPVVDEDVLDGSLARHHRAVILAGVDYLEPRVLAGLEAFRAGGGAVLVTGDSRVEVKGATRFDLPPDGLRLVADMDRWAAEKHWDRWGETMFTGGYFRAAAKVAEALGPRLAALGVRPVFECDRPGVIASRQALGDIEYLFAVNASPDLEGFGWHALATADAAIALGDDRPVYDAVRGGRVEEFKMTGDRLLGKFRFGPGQMRVFARTTRPIGGVQVMPPLQLGDYTDARDPVRVEVSALLVDERKRVLCGSAPLRVEVIDPLGSKRYDLYRATDRGVLRLTLPLAATDPAGEWTVRVHDLLGETRGEATFRYRPPAQCGALAGATRRAVLFGRDRENAFRFFRNHKDLTVVKGASKFHEEAAQRLTRILAPWDIRCTVVAAADVKRRVPTAEEKRTWVDAGGGAFDLRGAAVLLGSPEDNPLIRHLQEQKCLPYTPVRDQFPGRGRGLIAWQRDALAYFGFESLALVAHDEAGLAEAVGTAYEIAAGMEPLTPLALPAGSEVRPGTTAEERPAEPAEDWRRALPDRVAALRAVPGGVLALGADGTLCMLGSGGEVRWRKTFDGAEAWSLDVSRDGRLIALGAAHRLHVLDASGEQHWDAAVGPASEKGDRRSEGITCVAVAPDGSRVLAAAGVFTRTADAWRQSSMLQMFNGRGEKRWSSGGLDAKTRKPVLGERCSSAVFTADGKKVAVVADKKVRFLEAADGRPGPVLDGTHCGLLGDNVLVSDGESKLTLFAPAREKVLAEKDFGKVGPVTFAPAAGGVVVGTEADGAVQLLDAVGPAGRAVWRKQVYTHVVKAVAPAGGGVAVSYWGGTVRVFDAGGKLRWERDLGQDVAALAWSGRRLVVGLADGRVIALR